MSKIRKISAPMGNFSLSEVVCIPNQASSAKWNSGSTHLEQSDSPWWKSAIWRKKGAEKWGRFSFTYRKLPFMKNCIFSLVPVPNCSRTNARNSLIYLYCFAVWVLLYLAFAVTYDCVANNTRNIYLVEVSWREGIQGPFVSLLSKTCRDHPRPPSPASKGPKPCGF